MKLSKLSPKIGVIALATSAALFGAAVIQAQGNGQAAPSLKDNGQGQGANGAQGGKNAQGRGPAIDPAEEAGIKAFNAATTDDAKIQAGEDFEQKFPNSRYIEGI